MKIVREDVREKLRFEREHTKADSSPVEIGDGHGHRKSKRRASDAS